MSPASGFVTLVWITVLFHKAIDLLIAHSFRGATLHHLDLQLTRALSQFLQHSRPDTRKPPHTTRSHDLNMADSQDPTLPEADQVCVSQRHTRVTAILTPSRFARNALQNSEVLQVPHPIRRHHRQDHQHRHPQSRTQYLRRLPAQHRRQPLLDPAVPIAHNEHLVPAHLKRTYNLELCHLSSVREMDHNGQSQAQQERRRKLLNHGKTRCCDRCSELR